MKITAARTERRRGVQPPSPSSGRNVAQQLPPPYERALVQRQQIVIPVAVGVSSHVGRSPCRTNDTDVGPLTCAGIKNEKRIRPCFDTRDHLFTSPFPPGLRIPQMRDMFVGAVRMGFRDASYLYVCHLNCPFGA